MHTPVDFNETANTRTVYVKSVDVTDLPEELRASAAGQNQLYAVHNAEGEQLALVSDRRMAFVLARQHDYQPVHVH